MGVNGLRRNSGARLWAPSGPRIGDESRFYRQSNSKPDINPDPDNYKVVEAYEKNGFIVLKINYPNCTNYEGLKILVFHGITMIDLINQRKIDPHFFESKQYASPIVRFEPTVRGWEMALRFIETEIAHEKNR